MMRELSPAEQQFLQAHRVARLATTDAAGQPYAVPICYAFDGHCVYSALDEKPKSVAPTRLKRVRNIQANPRVALVIDDYGEDWSRLAYMQIRGQADLLAVGAAGHAEAVRLLRAKYPQYERMAIDQQPILRITPEAVVAWGSV
ncbi:MAG TPA: TIGR03668 family PPOX class F420-dependent oxidoreductase [Ktedonobacterales bacterium]|nr:TIGR03668 family PPOX class F420-dependent oxidoreductase [Ktedonobacterales bacterium]